MAKRIVTALAIILMVASQGALLSAGSGRAQFKVSLNTFWDGNSTEPVFFGDPGNDTTVQIKMPQRVTVMGASVNVSGQPYIINDSFIDTDRADFLASTLSHMDVNSSAGNATLDKPLDDAFNDLTLDPKWKWRNATTYDEGATSPGELMMTSAVNTTFWGNQNNGSLLYQNISGTNAYTWTVSVKVNGTPTLPGQRAGLMMFLDRNNWVEFSYARLNGTDTGLTRVNTSNGNSAAVTVPVGPGPVWLSFYRYGGTFRFSYSTNGADWLQNNSMNMSWNNFWNTELSVGLVVMDGNSGTPYRAFFDDYITSRYSGAGYMTSQVHQYRDEVQTAQLHWDASVPSWGAMTVYARVTPGDADWKTLSNHVTYEFYPKSNTFQYNLSMSGYNDSATTPVLREIWGNVTVKAVPYNVSLDLGNKGTPDWFLSGPLLDHPTTVNLASALVGALKTATPDGNGDVVLTLRIRSERRGTVTLSDLAIDYVVNSPPSETSQLAPANATWSTTVTPTLNFNASDPDGGAITYVIEIYPNGSSIVFLRLEQKSPFNGWSAHSYTSGEVASYTFPYGGELAQNGRYQWRVCAYDGWAYGPWSPKRELYVDNTPPEGWVLDDGTETSSPDTLHANLSITDEQSLIVKYLVWVGTAPNASDIVAPTEVFDPDVTFHNLTLIYGNRYYFTAKALNGAGLWSPELKSDGIGVKKGAVNHAPSVTMSYPADGASLTGVVKLRGNASDIDYLDALTTSVQVDNGEWLEAEGNRSWNLSWDSSRVENGPHKIQARAWDGRAFSALFGINVTITNVHEILITGAEPATDPRVSENQSITFSVSARDPFNRTLGYQWLVDGKPVTGETAPSFIYRSDYASAGVHNVTVSIFSTPMESHYTWNITVQNVNRPPVPAIAAPASGTEAETGKSVKFDATGSYDPDASDALNYSWDFGDGNQASGVKVGHTYKSPGSYTVTLTVSDPFTYQTTSIDLTVKEGPKASAGFLEQYGLYLMIGIVLLVAIAGIAVAFGLRKKEEQKPAGAGKGRAPAARPLSHADRDEQKPSFRKGMPVTTKARPVAAVATRPTYEAEAEPGPAAEVMPDYVAEAAPEGQPEEAASPGWTEPAQYEEPPEVQMEETTEQPAWATAPAERPAYETVEESAQPPAWSVPAASAPARRAATTRAAPAARAPAPAWSEPAQPDILEELLPMTPEEEVPEAAVEPMEAPAEQVAEQDDEMARILNMLSPPEEPAPAPQEEPQEATGMEDVFAKLKSISDEFEAGPPPEAPPLAPPAPAVEERLAAPAPPSYPPARRGEVRPPSPAPLTPPARATTRPAAPPAPAQRPATAPVTPPPARAAAAPVAPPAPRPAAAPVSPPAARPAAAPVTPPPPRAAAAPVAPTAPAAGAKKRLLRCPKCQVIFEVQDTGVRPLPIRCTACGTTGSLKK